MNNSLYLLPILRRKLLDNYNNKVRVGKMFVIISLDLSLLYGARIGIARLINET